MNKIIIAALLLLAPLSSQALFEIRAGYGVNNLDEDNYGAASLDNGTGFNVDAIIEPPLITDLGFGLRYETMSYDISPGSSELEMDRLALLINYRIIDFIGYLGLIGTAGISTDANIGSTDLEDNFNWSVGVEAGVNLGIFSIGAEVGKLFADFDVPASPNLEIDGMYGKILFGIGF